MNSLLDTHFLLWIVLGSARLDAYPWLGRYAAWGVSPVSFVEVQFLSEVGRLEVDIGAFTRAVRSDPRFLVDDLPLLSLVEPALGLSWTRDPFDRLLAAHSAARRTPLITVDRVIRERHGWIPEELSA